MDYFESTVIKPYQTSKNPTKAITDSSDRIIRILKKNIENKKNTGTKFQKEELEQKFSLELETKIEELIQMILNSK